MKKIKNNKLAIVFAILWIVTLIICVIMFHKTELTKISNKKVEQLTSLGDGYIKTSEHLEQMEQASQIEPMTVNMSISKSNNGLSAQTSMDISKYTKCTVTSISSGFGVTAFAKADGTVVNMTLTEGQVIDITDYVTFGNNFYNGWYTTGMSMTCELVFE